MKQFISNAFMILALIHTIGSFLTLFHIGTSGLNNMTIDKLSVAFLVIGCFYCIISLKIEINK